MLKARTKNREYFNHKFLLVSHYATYSMQDLLFEYLTRNKVDYITKINIPLPELPFLKDIEITHVRDGKLIKERAIKTIISPKPLAYLFQFFQFLLITILTRVRYDVIIAHNSLLTIAALWLRSLGKCKRVIFYSHGLDEARFSNKYLNKFYKTLDDFAATHSDLNWLLSKKMIAIRLAQGIEREKIYWVPTALDLNKMGRKSEVKNHKIIFLGTLNEMNGVMILPEVLKKIKETVPNVTLDIIGDGPLNKKLRKKMKTMNLTRFVNFLGVQTFADYCKTLTNYALGLAPYKPSKNNLLQLTDPMKLRLYTAAGLPIITTSRFNFSDEINENGLGFTVEYKSSEYADKAIQLLSNQKLSNSIRSKALMYSRQFDQEKIFSTPLRSIFYE